MGRPREQCDISGAPARTTGNAQYVVPLDVYDLKKFAICQLVTDWSLTKFTVCLGQNGFAGTNIDLAVFLVTKKSYGESYGEISEPCFPHNFTKSDRQDLKMGCIDAS